MSSFGRNMVNMAIPYFTTALMMYVGLAQGEAIDVLGQKIRFGNPAGYCTPGNTQRERDLMAIAQRSVGPGSRIVHAAIRCPELEAFRSGARDELDHWLQIQLIGPKGEFKRMEMGREAFLVGIAKTSPSFNLSEITRRINTALADTTLSLSKTQVALLGRDGNAVYFSSRMNLKVGNSSRPVTVLSAITLVNALPLTINVYEATGKETSREKLQPTLQQLLMSVLTEN
jgi:hypothetical protein